MNASPNSGGPGRSALLIIDVQQAMFTKSTPVFQADQLLENIRSLAQKARSAGAPIIWIQHSDARDLAPGTAGWQLHPALAPAAADLMMTKQKGNAFEGTNLKELLAASAIGSVVICGMVTHGCVKNTCLGALAEGYQVTLAADVHSSYSKDAAALIEKWNALLAEAGVRVAESAAISFAA
ncbi:MAG: isochorismatase family protein [Chloroflexi bacterium]|nr:isochorismatase family protein [Anaerolineaceae bacterium]NLI44912.1 isochorismatase family protein [Chloroflexota bacterium]HOE34927.1 isochorismatase family protein [Anaerolineaceae bacterium]HOT26199.1 isochorismatase family protein [Anaerolineaceae bacterium]HQK03844.1 isochorismatase family protein [Anaerolineaceae bacterium]